MIEFTREKLTPELASEVMPLVHRHFADVDAFPDIPPAESPRQYHAADYTRIFTAREDGRLIGYAVFIVTKHPHYADLLHAQQDLLYLDPEYRRTFIDGGLAGFEFLRFCDDELKAEGVQLILQHSSHRRDIGPLLKRMGYQPIQTLHARRLS